MKLDDIFKSLRFTDTPEADEHPIRGLPGSVDIKTGARLYGRLRPEIERELAARTNARIFRAVHSTYARERGYLPFILVDDAGIERRHIGHLDLAETERFNGYAT